MSAHILHKLRESKIHVQGLVTMQKRAGTLAIVGDGLDHNALAISNLYGSMRSA
jgi:hypothetical protein